MNESIGIRELASRTGLSPDTLRYYERAGLMIPVPRDTRGRRSYTEEHVRWVRFLTRLRAAGMGIKRIQKYTSLLSAGTDPDGARRLAMLREHRDEVRERVKMLQEHLEVLDRKVDSGCRPTDETSEEE